MFKLVLYLASQWCRLLIVIFFLTCHGKVISKKRICIIGAGRAGLAAVKLVADEIDKFEVVAFERNSDVGGLWIYRDSPYIDEHGLFALTGIYKSLKTNVPTSLMVYPDYFDFNKKGDSDFVSHETFLEYMKNYTDYFQLRKYIQFDTMVRKVVPIKGKGDWKSTTWRIDFQDLKTFEYTGHTQCNAVIVCNGRYSNPNMPSIPGLFETFRGQMLHSRTYRIPELFANEIVVILGAGSSGVDIALDLNDYAEKVYLSHRHDNDPFDGNRPNNVEVVPGVVSAEGNRFTLQDNSTIIANTLIYCTGYLLNFPFLDKRSDIVVEGSKIRPLFRDSLNVEHPSMIFVGLPTTIYQGGLYYDQVKWFLKLLQGEALLPTYEIMSEAAYRSSFTNYN